MTAAHFTAIIDDQRARIQQSEAGTAHAHAVLPFGITAMDNRLPQGGLSLGSLHEVAGGGEGAIHEAAAALFAAGMAARTAGKARSCIS